MEIILVLRGDDHPQCTAMTKRRVRCENPVVYSQVWNGDGSIIDEPSARQLAQMRCAVHVDASAAVPPISVDW